jgi:DNA recombination protein RmuC
MQYFIGFIVGLITGVAIVLIVTQHQRKQSEQSFSMLSQEVLRKNSEDFLKLANETLAKQAQTGVGELDSKKQLIDQTLQSIKGDLTKVEKLVNDSEEKRAKAYGEVSSSLKSTAEQTNKLQETTGKLQAALANTKVRGQWGERMAEDVLRFSGFAEGVNYLKQKTQELIASRPDYSFMLPQNMKLNMDVKFPLDNYTKYCNEENDAVKEGCKQQFLKDVRQRVKEVTTRDYINPAENTLDYVLVFIPSEQIYSFIHENDRTLMDDALKTKVILCSPLTLYAILSVVRQQMDNYKMEKTAAQMLSLFGTFNKQWDEYKKCMEALGKKIEQAHQEYDTLFTTRSRMLEKPLKQIDELRIQKGIPEAGLVDDEKTSETSIVSKDK